MAIAGHVPDEVTEATVHGLSDAAASEQPTKETTQPAAAGPGLWTRSWAQAGRVAEATLTDIAQHFFDAVPVLISGDC
jgi:hypothetical protein